MDLDAAFDYYERLFLAAMTTMPARRPWNLADKSEIVSLLKQTLGFREEWIPQMTVETVERYPQDGFSIDVLTATSWPNTAAAAHLYIPKQATTARCPVVVICCGHGSGCKLNTGYQAMARRLARQGAIVLVPDNIGQGERTAMGHRDLVVPFACGMSVQGLIVMETAAWIRWIIQHEQVDSSRTAAIGNSGGGTLTLLLGALCPEINVLSSSGYPSTFEFVARKEKKHCHCNILPGIVGELEMWQILGCFAPKPLFMFQGQMDHLFPEDIHYQTARKVSRVYAELRQADQFCFKVFRGGHSWDVQRREALSEYLARTLDLDPAASLKDDTTDCLHSKPICRPYWPEEASSADSIAEALRGKKVRSDLALWDVYPPVIRTSVPLQGYRGDLRQVFSQYEAFLCQRARTAHRV